MKKAKKELKPTQRKRRYKLISRSCFVSEFLSVAAPFIALAIANKDKWFVEVNGTQTTLGFSMALCMMGLAIYLVAKKKFDASFITLIVGWASVTGVLFLLQQIINDLAMIMMFGLFGIIGAYVLDICSKKAEKKAQEIQEGINKAKTDMTAQAYKKEVDFESYE